MKLNLVTVDAVENTKLFDNQRSVNLVIASSLLQITA